MFDEKDKIKFLAEGIRNISTGLVISGFVAIATTPYLVNSTVIAFAGLFVFASAYRIYEE